MKTSTRAKLGVRLLVLFFVFGTTMCILTIVTLLRPGTFLEPMWRLNPEAHRSFQSLGGWAIVLMSVVGSACLLSAAGLAKRAEWGRILAIAVLGANLIGDTIAAIARHDARTLIGLPIAGAMIFFLSSRSVRRLFGIG